MSNDNLKQLGIAIAEKLGIQPVRYTIKSAHTRAMGIGGGRTRKTEPVYHYNAYPLHEDLARLDEICIEYGIDTMFIGKLVVCSDHNRSSHDEVIAEHITPKAAVCAARVRALAKVLGVSDGS